MTIGLDSNALFAALVHEAERHAAVTQWLNANHLKLVTTGTNIAEVLRLVTHPAICQKPLTLNKALATLEQLLNNYHIAVLPEAEQWWQPLAKMVSGADTLTGNQVHDARIALCFKFHGVATVCTYDGDFKTFGFKKLIQP